MEIDRLHKLIFASFEERKESQNEINSLRKKYPYFQIAAFLEALLDDDPFEKWYFLKELELANPVLYAMEIERMHKKQEKEMEQEEEVKLEVGEEKKENEKQEIYTNQKTEILDYAYLNKGQDYFHEETKGMDSDLSALAADFKQNKEDLPVKEDQSLLRIMTFAEWLEYLKQLHIKKTEEEESKRALKAMWQREKLAKAMEAEEEEIPDEVFNMAIKSIHLEEEIISESMAQVYEKQENWEKAIEIYKKLSLRNPEKSSYFAEQIKKLEKYLFI